MQTANPESASLKLLVLGFNETERRLLQAIVKLSQRRTPALHLLEADEGPAADVILVDGQSPEAMQWAAAQAWLAKKAVGWVDCTGEIPANHTALKRPVQWPILPMLLSRIMFKNSGKAPAQTATAQPVSQFQPQATAKPGPPKLETASAGPAAAAPKEAKRVLVVDDSLAVRQQLQSFLAKRGMNADFADSGDEAIARCQNVPYVCILLDVLMPGMDGYETCRRIKALPHMLKRVKVIMLTSRTSPFDRIRGKMAGCDAYLTKPVQAQTLYTTLNEYLSA